MASYFKKWFWKKNKNDEKYFSPHIINAFDVDFYLKNNPDVVNSGIDPLLHYMNYGWREGRDPRPDFSTEFYINAHNIGPINPLVHWVEIGKKTKLPTQPQSAKGEFTCSSEEREAYLKYFDPDYYLKQYPDVANAGIDPLTHYMIWGWKEQRNPSRDFSTKYYISSNTDIARAEINPFWHYVFHGKAEGRYPLGLKEYHNARHFSTLVLGLTENQFELIKSEFDSQYYCQQYNDVELDPLLHYLFIGWKQHRKPAKYFDGEYYLNKYPDISSHNLNPFVHWVLHGRAEGRITEIEKSKHVDHGSKFNLANVDWTDYSVDDVNEISQLFDESFYINTYPEVLTYSIDPRIHYLLAGWKLGYDPCPNFSTTYYIDRYVDIKNSGVNPFLHYCQFGHKEHRETKSYIESRKGKFRPLVSVIIPNFNHAKYLKQRINSIANQTYDNLEIIILDDKSTDDSQAIIQETISELNIEASLIFNDSNSGNVFAQWQKGLANAKGELVWICESDDFCEFNFLEHIVPTFIDESINISFGRIQFSDNRGNFQEGLDAYRENAEPRIWDKQLIRPAKEWFDGAFGVNNIIANVGGCVFRRVSISDCVWREARNYKICGDWFLYIHIAGAGQIAFVPDAIAYFRQHGANTSASNFNHKYYYDENIRILQLIIQYWGIPKSTRIRFLQQIENQFNHFDLASKFGRFKDVYDTESLLREARAREHIQICFLGFYSGGGELFPINLANALHDLGYLVSMLAVDMTEINSDMANRLYKGIPVYHASQMAMKGRAQFFEECGVTLINSHIAAADAFLYTMGAHAIERPWVVTLHGSYVGFESAPTELVNWITGNVTSWIYTADRNLDFFNNRKVDWDNFVKLPNAMPRDCRDAGFKRSDLGISEKETVFVLVARGIKRKGWRAAIEGFSILREKLGKHDVQLILVGDGEATDSARALAKGMDGVHFLGYQSTVNGVLRLSDCLILPTRFEGESYPLCLIQALQEGLPVIATDIGEIRSMMTESTTSTLCGILLKNQRDSRAFFLELAMAMKEMCDPNTRSKYALSSNRKATEFDLDRLALAYKDVYDSTMVRFANERNLI